MRFLVLLALCLPLLVPAASTSAQPKPLPQPGTWKRSLEALSDSNTQRLVKRAFFVDGSVNHPVFSRDGQMLAYMNGAFRPRIVRLRGPKLEDVVLPDETRTQLVSLFRSSVVATQGGAFSPDGKLLALIRVQGGLFVLSKTDVVVLNTQSWKIVRAIPMRSRQLTNLAFSSDGARFVVGDTMAGATVYETATGKMLTMWNYRNGFKSAVVGFAKTPKGEHALALTVGRTPSNSSRSRGDDWEDPNEFPEIWDIEAVQVLAQLTELTSARQGAFSSDGQRIAVIGTVRGMTSNTVTTPRLLIASWSDLPSRRRETLDFGLEFVPPTWTPDDRAVLLCGFDGDAESVRVFVAKSQIPAKP